MVEEILDFLQPAASKTYLDCTLGMGGHSEALLSVSQGQINLIAVDRDQRSLELAKDRLSPWQDKIQFLHSRFSEIPSQLKANKKLINGGILLDLGISSWQLEQGEYTLSFGEQSLEEEIDMRLDLWCKTNAKEILNTYSQKRLADLFWELADYPKARALARMIVANRPLKKMREFVDLCKQLYPHKKRIHPATLPLMALRIAVNEEFSELQKFLQESESILEPGAKIIVLSFHSGEDRLVKNYFKQSNLIILTPKPLTPSRQEIKSNPRARSVKLRAAEQINEA